ncbi:Fur family transcriptional regulator [Nocardioides donggukensis]|uniref:Transcriptional repressor n=1 Tax=Nocardioides donggukensis TaxID=2774019 RepID=A0A927K1U0_9ACTN|nr:transcriptional repressor [Nocardioides donggukensis]MBD8868324.1 transcriptional repressor [Nocardioides donggukensis]
MSDDFADRLRSSGKRLTPQRELILRAVEALGHATPDEVLAEVRRHASAVNVSTVYRNLEVLEELGLVRHAHLSDRAPTYHSVGGHEHFHLVCRTCRDVTSVGAEEFAALGTLLQEKFGFGTDIGHLTLFGTCRRCAARAAEGSDRPDGGAPPTT